MDPSLSFSEIYRQHADAVFRLAWMLSGNRSDAEDLTSEAFARALAGAGRIEQTTVRSYLVSSRQRRPQLELAADEDRLGNAVEPEPGPEQRAALRQQLARASTGLDALRAADRQVLLLCGVHGLSNLEIADALGLPPGHVRVRLHRARRQLAALVNHQGVSDEPA